MDCIKEKIPLIYPQIDLHSADNRKISAYFIFTGYFLHPPHFRKARFYEEHYKNCLHKVRYIERVWKMGAFIGGPLSINTIGGQAIVNFGGTLFISPKNASKSFNGSGGGHTSAISFGFYGPSATNTVDNNVIEQPVTLNN